MDSIYIVSKNTEQGSIEIFHQMLSVVIDLRLLIISTFYAEENKIPVIRTKTQLSYLTEFNEKEYPEMEMYIFETPDLYKSDNNFPISQNNFNYYPMISLRCRNDLFLLDFVIEVLKSSGDFLVCNVENRLVSIEELLEFKKRSDYDWAYR